MVRLFKLRIFTRTSNALVASVLLVASVFLHAPSVSAAQHIFPVIGNSSYRNDYNASRANGKHHAIDIMASKHQNVVSATDGTITFVGHPQPSWGYAVFIRSTGGYIFKYLHLNNDAKGTDNGRGGPMNAYAPDIKVGNPVVKGQLIGKVGDSGNAESTAPHLHFEIERPNNGGPFNPYNNLRKSKRIKTPVKYPALPGEILPFGNSYNYGMNVALGNLDGDQQPEIVAGAGYGSKPRIRIYDHNNQFFGYDFYAFNTSYQRGVDVAVGDVDNDNVNEIVIGSRVGSGARVAVYELLGNGAVERTSDFAAHNSMGDDLRVATGNVDGTGADEIIVGAGVGAPPNVNVFRANGEYIRTIPAAAASYNGGLDVAAGDVVGTTADEIVVSQRDARGTSLIKVYSGTGTLLNSFYAYGSGFRGGSKVSVGNVITSSAKSEILTAPYAAGAPKLQLFDNTGQALRTPKYFMEEWWRGYYDVAAGYNATKSATGVTRRGAIKPGF